MIIDALERIEAWMQAKEGRTFHSLRLYAFTVQLSDACCPDLIIGVADTLIDAVNAALDEAERIIN